MLTLDCACQKGILKHRHGAVRYTTSCTRTNYRGPTPKCYVSIDERRKEFAVTDFGDRVLQVGFRGVHSDSGGGYGGNIFEFITLNFVLEQAEARNLAIFKRGGFMKLPIYRRQHSAYELMKSGAALHWAEPTDNSNWKFNDNEVRHLPQGLLLHESVDWFRSAPLNSIEKFGRY